MLEDKNFWKIHLKWGVIVGAMLIAIEVLKMYARKVDYSAGQLLDLAMILGFVLALYHGVKEFKEYYPERLSFAKAFISCIVMSLTGAVLLFGYDLLHYSVLEKDGLQQKYVSALGKYRQNLAKDTLTAQELTSFTDAATALLQEQKESVLGATSFAGFAGMPPNQDTDTLQQMRNEINSGLLIFQKFYTEKILSKPTSDSEEYQLGKFTPYAKKVLMETLVSYIEQNKEKPSTPYVQEIVLQTNERLAELDPLETRFEETKSRVPRYDRNGQYAAISAVIYLLYGMFFGLFIAMFHYTSKKPAEEFVPSENEETE